MDVNEFDDISSLHWQNQFDALSNVNIEFPVDHSTVEIFPDDLLEINEDITVVTSGGSTPVNIVPTFPSRIESPNSVPSPIWSASGLQVIPPISRDDVLQPTSINASWSSVTTCVSNSDFWGQRRSYVTELTSPPAKVRQKQSSPARTSSQKPVKQFHSKDSIRMPTLEEHILRERKRRDEMAERFLLLEKILPRQARRQKAEIVEDTIKLVKSLKLRKDELLKRRAQMKLMLVNRNRAERSPQYPRCQSTRYPSLNKSAIGMQFAAIMKPQLMQGTPSSTFDRRKPIDTGMPIIMGNSPQYPIAGATVEDMAPWRIDTSTCRYLLQMHAQVSDDEILVDMLFRQYSPNLHTRVMQTVETMKLEVIRGSMQRLVPCGFIECIITAKSRVECQSRHQDIQSSARLLIGALQVAFMHD